MAKRKNSKWKGLIVLFFIGGLVSLFYYILTPDLSMLMKKNPKKTAFMEHRENEAKAKGRKFRIHQTFVSLSKISPYLAKAVLISEDDNFWRHEGFDYEAIQKAFEKDLKAKKFKFGGSTISQQLARNLYLSPSKNLWRKIREAVITWSMEKTLSKRRILELYLNLVEWGDGIFGAEAASQHYFGKSCSELTPMEAARLAAVLPSPKKLHPDGDQRYVVSRANVIYSIMVRRGIVIPEFEEEDSGSPPAEEENPSLQKND
jgi:monofunctional glycosyltransferase